MNGNWLRVSPDELEQARTDLDWAYELAMTERDDNSERWAATDKAWNGLDFLLDRLGLLAASVLVEQPGFADAALSLKPHDPSGTPGHLTEGPVEDGDRGSRPINELGLWLSPGLPGPILTSRGRAPTASVSLATEVPGTTVPAARQGLAEALSILAGSAVAGRRCPRSRSRAKAGSRC